MAFVVAASAIGLCQRQGNAAEKPPALFDSIKTAPENETSFTPTFSVNHDGDGEGEELPASIIYSKKDSDDFGTSMTVTDFSLCKRPVEKKICQAFVKMISDAPPTLGADVTETRIGGAGYGTVFLARVDSVILDGVDSSTAFIGSDSQDPPLGQIVLYVYAKKGTNLIQLSAPVDQCAAEPKPNESDISYYKRCCVSETILKKANAEGKKLTELFRLKR